MKIEMKFVELHNPLFLAGTNLQLKLDQSKRPELKMVYDRKWQELHVTMNGHLAIVPMANVSSMWPKDIREMEKAEDAARAFPLNDPKKANPCKPS